VVVKDGDLPFLLAFLIGAAEKRDVLRGVLVVKTW
jgi:hypothetical protein